MDIELEVYFYIYLFFSASKPTSVRVTGWVQDFVLTLVAWELLFFMFVFYFTIPIVSLRVSSVY